jgi:hypothetical protein
MKIAKMRYMMCATVAVAAMSLTACSNMSNRDQRMLSGAGIGAGTGAAIGAVTGGSPVTGAVIGGAAGAAGGYIYDQNKK